MSFLDFFKKSLKFPGRHLQRFSLASRDKFQEFKIYLYSKNGRKPWSYGYNEYKEKLLRKALSDMAIAEAFKNSLPLPKKYGEFVDERIVEYPWIVSCLDLKENRLLDAGSALNHIYLLEHPSIKEKEITIVTLEPEESCYWKNRISYLFADLRELPFQDDWFDEVVSISTLEHVGMNNEIYSSNPMWHEKRSDDFLKAVTELKRVTRVGGKVFITVPYGKYTDFGWYQQFDQQLIDELIDCFNPCKVVETYFCYEDGGWKLSDKEYCGKFEGFNIHDTKYMNPSSTKDFDPDFAACSRAIAALELWK